MNDTFDFSTAGKYRLPPDLHRARFTLLDAAIERQQPIPAPEAAALLSEQGFDGPAMLARLAADNIIGLDEDESVAYLYPVSVEETGHRVRLADGREFHTMCAIDSLGCAATFQMPVELYSFCKDSGAVVYARINTEEIEQISPSRDLQVSYYDSWIEGSFNF